MSINLVSLLVGFLFALGLGVSGMTQPQRVVGFLDIFGTWNPALAFVMIGAIFVHAPFYFFIRKRKAPILTQQFQLPEVKKITLRLVIGSALFGIGWGLAGYCPGPAVTSLMSFNFNVYAFVASMILGMIFYKIIKEKLDSFL
jgi:uncharacterized protein